MSNKNDHDIYIIPPNFIESGTFFGGMFRARNVIEAGIDALCEALWGDNPFGYENSLNAHVRRVREKIETDPSKPVSLITIKGLGYKLIARK